MKVRVGNKRVSLDPRRLVGQGGEAEVYAHGRHRVLKVFKQPDHSDFAGDPSKVAAARARLDEHQTKLRDFPTGLPASVIAPDQLVHDDHSGAVVGYSMKRISGADSLYKLGDARTRRALGLPALTASLVSLHDAVAGLHARGVVIGDFNDLNVLVRASRAHLIDADSFQFGHYQSAVYCERFVDPLLCDESSGQLAPTRPFSVDSDWYAFAIMVSRTLLSVEPYGGVHLASGSTPRVRACRRPFERLSIFNAPVRLPRPALAPRVLPDPLRAHLESVFAADKRGPMPRALLEICWQHCASCGLDHGHPSCPDCTTLPVVVAAPTARTTALQATRVRAPEAIATLRARATAAVSAGGDDRVWLEGRRLFRRGALGPEHIGDVLADSTRFWVGTAFGFGFYAVGRLQVGFVFDTARGGLNDQIALPPIRGTLADAHVALSESHAWLLVREQVGPALVARLSVFSNRGAPVASSSAPAQEWLDGLRGACALGPYLFVPTDGGVVRLEVNGGSIGQTKSFPDTADFVDSSTTLLLGGSSLFAVTPTDITALATH